ncbi:MAG TPA: ABC transporter substrate-binding protein [Geminicoccaceae bacterium]
MTVLQRNRRGFIASASFILAAGALGAGRPLADEPPPETTTLRLQRGYTICLAPGQIAEELLRAEGFTDIRYVDAETVARGEADFAFQTAAWVVSRLDSGDPLTALAGVHSGCYELFAHEPIRAIRDLKGRRVGIPQELGSSGHLLLASIAAYVGLDHRTDIDWVSNATGDFFEPFARGEVDAFLGFPPEPQALRARGIGHVILDTTLDQPWSQYFCCIVFGNRDFVRAHPIATKRYLRAVLKAADVCATDPERAARRLIEAGFADRYDYALQTLNEVPYDRWREFDPEDALRFYALRLHEAGMITATPNDIIAAGTDWRFLGELRRELKA